MKITSRKTGQNSGILQVFLIDSTGCKSQLGSELLSKHGEKSIINAYSKALNEHGNSFHNIVFNRASFFESVQRNLQATKTTTKTPSTAL